MKIVRTTCLLFLSLSGIGQAASPVENRDYFVLQPVAAATRPAKVVVVELFSFHCTKCNANQKRVKAWLAKLPVDVQIERVLVPTGGEPRNRAYLALQQLGKGGDLDAAIYRALHEQGRSFPDLNAFIGWLETQGVAREAFQKAYDSFAVTRGEIQARNLLAPFAQSDHSAIPAILIGGRYLVDIQTGAALEARLAVSDELVARARAELLAAAGSGGP